MHLQVISSCIFLGFSIAACADPVVEPAEPPLWGGAKADDFDEGQNEGLLGEAFPDANPFSCANLDYDDPGNPEYGILPAPGILPGEPPLDSGWESTTSTEGHFLIHYTRSGEDRVLGARFDLFPHNGTPDFVDQVARGAELAWERYHTELGYLDPSPGQPVVITIRAAGEYFGFVSGGQIVIDHAALPFAISPHFLRATVAHEYFHIVQQGYEPAWLQRDRWLTEATAVWAEDEATGLWDGLVGAFVRDLMLADRLQHGVSESLMSDEVARVVTYPYSSYVFYQFLAEQSGDANVIRNIFEQWTMPTVVQSYQAVEAALAQRGSTLVDAFREYSAWNYLVGSRAEMREDGFGYSDARFMFHGLLSSHVEASHDAPPSEWQTVERAPGAFAVNYIELERTTGDARPIAFELQTSLTDGFAISTLERSSETGLWRVTHHPADSPSVVMETTGVDRIVFVVQRLVSEFAPDAPRLEYTYRMLAQ